jgi:hypothetical protein
VTAADEIDLKATTSDGENDALIVASFDLASS